MNTKGGAHEEIAVHKGFVPLSRATANTLYNLDTAIGDAVGIDLQGYKEALISIFAGAVAGGASIAYTLFTADVDDAESATLAVVEKANGDDAVATIADTEDNTIELIRIRPQDVKRYLFIRRVQTGAFASVESVTVLLTGRTSGVPVTQPSGTTVAFNMDT